MRAKGNNGGGGVAERSVSDFWVSARLGDPICVRLEHSLGQPFLPEPSVDRHRLPSFLHRAKMFDVFAGYIPFLLVIPLD